VILFFTCLVSLSVILGLFGLTIAFYFFLRGVDRCRLPDHELPFVSILVPARNEELKIGRCLESLLNQDYPNFELVVIDDRSTDRTGEIIEQFAKKDNRVKFVRGKDAPDGWIGKCNALAHAVGYASGDWFVFTDADTCHKPNSVRDAVSYALSTKSDLISFVPLQELKSFWERVVMTVLLSSFVVGDPFHAVNDPRKKRAYAYGQYILCRKNSYLAIGGHQSVRDEIVEDHAIAQVFKEKGYKILVADGKTLYSVRMYTNLETMWQGWTKNLYSLIDSRIINLVLIVLLINFSVFVPWVELALVARAWIEGDINPYLCDVTNLVVAQFFLLIVWFKLTQEHRQGVNWSAFFLMPLGSLAVTVLQIHAAYLVLSGSQVKWKGRQYTVNTAKTIQPMIANAFERRVKNTPDR